ncbi:MAG: LptF/LptG family permease [Helicobacteraceae bacterium]|nr:LptF/LptG family permease [Helicobacteraceae bacterium]
MRGLLDRYLLVNLWGSFFPLFGSLVLIASVVSFVQIASYSSIIKTTLSEMALLYVFQLPEIVLYTLPVSFFVAVMISLSKLSSDLEMVVIFGFKVGVLRIMRPFMLVAVVLALILALLGFMVSAKSDYLRREIIYAKRDDAQINIRAGEFGQRFGDWLLFVGEEGREDYKGIALYSRGGNGGERFIVSDRAQMRNDGGLLTLNLLNGRSYDISEGSIRQIDFERMRFNENSRVRELQYDGIAAHWQNPDYKRKLIWTILSVMFLPLSMPAAMLGIHHPRVVKNYTGPTALALSVLFFIPALLVGKNGGFWTLLVPLIWFLFTFWLYKTRLKLY